MKKELETIIENKFDCLINDLGCLIGEEWKAEAVKKAVNQAFVLGGVINWVACKDELPNENKMEKTIYDLDLHEQIMLKDRDVLIERVASGWIYKYQKEIYHEAGEYYEDITTHIVFVPYDNNFQKVRK